MSLKAKNRWQAFGLHLLCSLLIFIALASVIYFLWYPGFLFFHDGGVEGMRLIAGVDFIIGPVLTLMVYKAGKKGMLFDMVCIACFQIACLMGGMWAVWKTRPMAVIYAAGSYSTVNSYSYESQKIDTGKISLFKERWPVWIAVDVPAEEEEGIVALWAMTGSGIEYNTDSYVPYSNMLPKLEKKGLRAADISHAVQDFKKYEEEHPDVRFFPIKTSEVMDAYAAVDIRTGQILTVLE